MLASILRRRPELYDLVFPRGPVGGLRTGVDVAGPSPDPWRAGAAGAALVNDLFIGAIIVVGGREPGAIGQQFLSDVEDWCGNGWPRWRPRPKGPGGAPLDDREAFEGGAAAAAVLADSFDHSPELQEAIGAASERLAEQAARLG